MTEGVWCFIICFGVMPNQPEAAKEPIDTFCHSYRKVVNKKDEIKEIMRLSKGLRTKLQGNELEYMCRCLGWKNKVCQTTSGSTKQ